MTNEAIETVTIRPEEQGRRLDRVLAARIPSLSRSRLKALILGGQVAIAARTIRDPATHVNSGDTVTVTLPAPEAAKPAGEPIPLNIVYEDDALIVIDKPTGLVVHPAAGHATGTLVNALIAHCGDSLSGIGGVKRPGIVHRLDKDTTGLMVVAKTDAAHRALSAQFADKTESGIERGYLALVWGAPDAAEGHHRRARSTAIRRPATNAPCAKAAARPSPIGRCWSASRGADGKPVASLLACTLETGRTHQIRVHLAHIGHPILGDATYGTGFKTKASRLSAEARDRPGGSWQTGPACLSAGHRTPRQRKKPAVPIGTAGRPASFT